MKQEGRDLLFERMQAAGVLGLNWSGLLEVCGRSGSGKTQWSMQLCADWLLRNFITDSSANNNMSSMLSVVVLDTAGSWSRQRFESILVGTARDFEARSGQLVDSSRWLSFAFSAIRHHLVADVATLMEILLQDRSPPQMIVLDCLATLYFEQTLDDTDAASDMVSMVARHLHRLSAEFGTISLVTNYLKPSRLHHASFDRIDQPLSDHDWQPSMGDSSWDYWCTHRLALCWGRDDKREAVLFKSPALKNMILEFRIEDEGINPIQLWNQ